MTSEEDPLHGASSAGSTWSRTNAAEAIPGVLSPLGWTVWGPAAELGQRSVFRTLRTLSAEEARLPTREQDRVLGIFFGRPALRCDFFCSMGDRLPGTTGPDVARQLLSDSLAAPFTSNPQPRYYPQVAIRLAATALRVPTQLRRARSETDAWWRQQINTMTAVDTAEAVRRFDAGTVRFARNVSLQAHCVYAAIQPVYDQLLRIAQRVGVNGHELTAGYGGHQELSMVTDLWSCSRGQVDLDVFLARHGYHGPREGELSSHVWREDPKPVLRILSEYESVDDEASPAATEEIRALRRNELEKQLLSALPRTQRPIGSLLLTLAARYVPLRSVAKTAFLQALDVTRAAARRLGKCLVADGWLTDAEDVFFLTATEIRTGQWDGARSRIAERRNRFAEYERMELPIAWTGMPSPLPVSEGPAREALRLDGVGVSPGTVEGRVCVVDDPSVDSVAPNSIVVAHTTDPSWAAVLFMSSALVIDIGGMLSHAAVVARELGVPCVANTGFGTKVLRSGDLCRVDGNSGMVEILERGLPTETGSHGLD